MRSTTSKRSFSITWLKFICVFLWITIRVAKSQQCSQYSLPSEEASSLHCANILAPCDYFLPVNGLLLATAESQLSEVFHVAEIGVTASIGALSQACLDGFVSFYCHQVYTLCEEVDGRLRPVASPLCGDDCERVISSNCSGSQWSYLVNAVNQLQMTGIIQTPVLQQSCSDYATGQDPFCTSLELDPERCIPTSQPSETTAMPTQAQFPTSLVLGLCIGLGLPILSIVIPLVLVCCCCVRFEREEHVEGDSGLGELQTDFEFESPPGKTYGRTTLLMRPSAIYAALFGNPTPRTGTVVRRLESKEFTKMSAKQRLQVLEFPHSNICIVKDLGCMSFGKLHRGEAMGLQKHEVSTTVFIKSLRERSSSKLKQQFEMEMTWVSGFSHPNILPLLGVCTKEEPQYMIFEFLEYGSLKGFLQATDSTWFNFDEALAEEEEEEASSCASSNSPMLGIDDLANFGCQVAEGMEYLSRQKAFVHKDVATRNCHVGQGLRVKIANFGLSYDPESKDYCHVSSTKSNAPVPLRWLAPETLRHGKFSVPSDLWSFGVLLWELFSFGAQPYSDLSNAQVVKKILNFQLLPKPEKCPDSVYMIMLKCWHKSPSKRPWFSNLCKELSEVFRSLDTATLKKSGRVSSHSKMMLQ